MKIAFFLLLLALDVAFLILCGIGLVGATAAAAAKPSVTVMWNGPAYVEACTSGGMLSVGKITSGKATTSAAVYYDPPAKPYYGSVVTCERKLK